MPTKGLGAPVDLVSLFYRQRGLCYWCKGTMHLDGNELRSATRDHIIPQSAGGKSWLIVKGKKVKNVVAACKGCNNRRGSMPAEDFRRLIKQEINPNLTTS